MALHHQASFASARCSRLLAARLRRRRRPDAAHRPRRGPRRARSDARAHVRRPHRLRRAVRQAVRHRREAQHRAAARDRLRVVGRQQGADDQAAARASPSTTARSSTPPRSSSTSSATRRCRAPTAAASWRRSRRVDVVDPMTVRLNLKAPFSPLLAAARRPRRHDGVAQGRAGGRRQVRRQAGLLRARSASSSASRRTASSLERFPTTGTRARSILDKIVYLPIVDCDGAAGQPASPGSSTSSSGWRRPTSPALKTRQPLPDLEDHRDRLPGHHDERRQERPREDDRDRQGSARARGLRARARPRRHRAGGDGRRGDAGQPVGRARQHRIYAKNVPIPKRDVARAKALLKEAGVPNPTVTLMTPTTSDAQKIAQVVQAMVKEAGFDVKIQSTEFATSLDLADKGQFDAYVLGVERPRRSRRQHLQLRRLQAAARTTPATASRRSTSCSTSRGRCATRPSGARRTSRSPRSC